MLSRVDIGHLHGVPIRTVNELSNVLSEVIALVNDVISKSFPSDQGVDRGVVRPLALVQNTANINSWRGQLENHHAALFQLAGPIVAQQEDRRAWIGAPPIRLDKAPLIKEGVSDILWRYMPIRNLLRCESASGIWMSSMQRLRIWSRPGIPDIREGDVHPVIQRLKDRFDQLGRVEARDWIPFEYGTAVNADKMLEAALTPFNPETTFVSSWARRKNESGPMWIAYGDQGNGVAIKSHISMIQGCKWRAPLDLCGYIGGNRMKGLTLRDVWYLDFDESEGSIRDERAWYPPLLKRCQFEDEHETRLLAFTDGPVASMGFTLHCNLTEIISEIMIGPHADFAQTENQIRAFAPDLNGIKITRSKLAPE